ncbi:MAG: nitrate/nitrite transporter [Candidatus Geothermarchaeales archaeon]
MRDTLRYRWVMLALAFSTAFTLHLLLFSYSPLISQMVRDLRLTHAQAGLIFSACVLPLALLRIPWGLLCDRVGFRATLSLAVVIIAASGLLRGFAATYEMLIAIQVILGMGLSAIMPSLPKVVAAWFPRRETGMATGLYVAGFSLGNVVGLSLTPYVLSLLGYWRDVFRVYGAWGVILAVMWLTLSRRPAEVNRSSNTVRSEAPSMDFIAILRMREVWVLTGLFLCAVGSYDTMSLWLPYVLELKGIQPVTAGLIATMLPLGFLFAGPVVGTLSDRVGVRRPFTLTLGFISGPTIFLIGVTGGIPLWIATFAAGFCTVGILTLVLVIPIESMESTQVSSAIGLISSVGNASSILLPIAVGYIKDAMGSFLPALALIAVVAEGALILGLIMKEAGVRDGDTGVPS